jgi:hypothetical protein
VNLPSAPATSCSPNRRASREFPIGKGNAIMDPISLTSASFALLYAVAMILIVRMP